jgi:hypothetical protein
MGAAGVGGEDLHPQLSRSVSATSAGEYLARKMRYIVAGDATGGGRRAKARKRNGVASGRSLRWWPAGGRGGNKSASRAVARRQKKHAATADLSAYRGKREQAALRGNLAGGDIIINMPGRRGVARRRLGVTGKVRYASGCAQNGAKSAMACCGVKSGCAAVRRK